jgi:hypothetical protein
VSAAGACAQSWLGPEGRGGDVSAIDRIPSFEVTYFLPNGSRNPYIIIEFQCTIETSAFADNHAWYWD